MPYVIGRPPKRALALVATTVGMLCTAAPALAEGQNWNYQGGQQQAYGQYWNYQDGQVPQVAATPASPVASCPGVLSTPLLSGLSDSAYYAPVSGGTFEGSTAGWSFRDASVVSGNEPWNVVSATDSNSLGIAAGGSATSPAFCLDNTIPSFRFFANSAGGGWRSGLNVAVRWTLANGASGQIPVTTLPADGYANWQVSPALPLGSVLPAGQTVTVQFVFTAGTGSAWQIDDVLLDPYAK